MEKDETWEDIGLGRTKAETESDKKQDSKGPNRTVPDKTSQARWGKV